jgi:hypothetical protein
MVNTRHALSQQIRINGANGFEGNVKVVSEKSLLCRKPHAWLSFLHHFKFK